MITVSFEGKRIGLMKEDLTLRELEMVFPLDPPGAHLKVKTSAGYQNIWLDSSGKFNVPPDCGSAILVAMHREDEQERNFMPSSDGLPVGIRGASAVLPRSFHLHASMNIQVPCQVFKSCPGAAANPFLVRALDRDPLLHYGVEKAKSVKLWTRNLSG